MTPAPALYKDVNLSSPTPNITKEHILGYLQYFQKDVGSAQAMYADKYLNHVRYCIEGSVFLIKCIMSSNFNHFK